MRHRIAFSFAVLILVLLLALIVWMPFFIPHPAHGKGGDGDPSMCGMPFGATSSGSDGSGVYSSVLTIISECESVPLDRLSGEPAGPTADDLEEWERDLWSIGRIPRAVYRYRLTVINDSARDIRFNLSDWEVIHSPYTRLFGDFSIQIADCSKVSYEFFSPWAPEFRVSPINTMERTRRNSTGWTTSGEGQAGILVPVWFQFAPGAAFIGHIRPEGAESAHCKNAAR